VSPASAANGAVQEPDWTLQGKSSQAVWSAATKIEVRRTALFRSLIGFQKKKTLERGGAQRQKQKLGAQQKSKRNPSAESPASAANGAVQEPNRTLQGKSSQAVWNGATEIKADPRGRVAKPLLNLSLDRWEPSATH
jgi:hypothetical protein